VTETLGVRAAGNLITGVAAALGDSPHGALDDESVVAHTLKVLLQGEHDLVVAQSGAEALELLQQEGATASAFDVILCDLMMPGMTTP